MKVLPDNNLQNSELKTFLLLSFVIMFTGIDLNSPLFFKFDVFSGYNPKS